MPNSDFDSMQELLDAVTSNGKQAADDVNPPTSSQIDGKPEGETMPSEGERSAENDAYIRDTLGSAGAEGAPPATANNGTYNESFRATPVAPAGEDKQPISSSPPSEVEPGTSAPGLSLGEKVSSWRKDATELLIDYSVEAKTAAQTGKVGEPNAAAGKEAGDAANSQDHDNPYLNFAGGDEQAAKEAYEIVHSQLVAADLEGRKMASLTLDYLKEVKEGKAKEAAAPSSSSSSPTAALARRKLAMGMPPVGTPSEEVGGEMPPAAPPEEAMPMGDAMGSGEMVDDPAVIEQALTELAAEMGISPEELIAQLQAEASGGEGGPPSPPEAGPPTDVPAVEGPAPIEGSNDEGPKEGSDLGQRLKVAAAITEVKKRALDALKESVQRGQR